MNILKSNYDRGRYTWIFTTVNVRFMYPLPRSVTASVRTNPNQNCILTPTLSNCIRYLWGNMTVI